MRNKFPNMVFATTTYLYLQSCSGLGTNKFIPPPSPVTAIHNETLEPNNNHIMIPDRFLNIQIVTRDYGEIREGPGSKYPLKNYLCEKSQRVILLSKLGRWSKIYIPIEHKIGWIHSSALSRKKPKGLKYILDRKLMSKTFSIKSIIQAHDFYNKPIPVNFEKGKYFHFLKQNRNRVLVINPNTMSLMWLKKSETL